jgi:hypothetical protein
MRCAAFHALACMQRFEALSLTHTSHTMQVGREAARRVAAQHHRGGAPQPAPLAQICEVGVENAPCHGDDIPNENNTEHKSKRR